MQKLCRGDIWYYDFGMSKDGSVENKRRPVIIISNDAGNKFGSVVTIVPVTTRDKSSCKPWQVYFEIDGRPQVILCEQCRCVNSNKLSSYVGRVDASTMKKIDVALAIEFDLNTVERELNESEFLDRLDKCIHNIVDKHVSKSSNNDSKMNELNYRIDTVISNELDTIKEELRLIKSAFNRYLDNTNNLITDLTKLICNINTSKQTIESPKSEIITKENVIKNNDNEINTKDIKKSKRSRGRAANWQPEINYEDVDGLIEFINECNDNSISFICKKYNLTSKQLSNRKYLITQSLRKRNIEFTLKRKTRKDI